MGARTRRKGGIVLYVSCSTWLSQSPRDTMTRVMSLPLNTVIEYKAHNISLRYIAEALLPASCQKHVAI